MIDTYRLPEWLFKRKVPAPLLSTTVAAFSPEQGVKSSTGAFQSCMIPAMEEDNLQKMTLLLNSATIRFSERRGGIKTAHVITHLLALGFRLFIIHQGRACHLLSTAMMSEGDNLDRQSALDILVRDEKIPVDEIVVCDATKLDDLVNQLFDRDYRYENLVGETLIDQWDISKQFPKESPPVPDELLEHLGDDGVRALRLTDLKFSVTLRGASAPRKEIPWDRIENCSFSSQMSGQVPMNFPSLKNADIYIEDESEASNVLLGTLNSAKNLEKLNIDLNNYPISHAVKYLEGRESISSLRLRGGDLSHESVSISTMPNVHHLNIESGSLSSTGLEKIGVAFPHLDSLVITSIWKGTAELNLSPQSFISLKRLQYERKRGCNQVFFPLLKQTKILESLEVSGLTLEDYDDIDGMSLSELTNLTISYSEIDINVLFYLLRIASNLEVLKLVKVKISLKNDFDSNNLSLSSMKKFVMNMCDWLLLEGQIDFFGPLLRAMSQIEDISISGNEDNSSAFKFNWNGHDFRNLKSFRLMETVFDEANVEMMLRQSMTLRHVDFSRSVTNGFKKSLDFMDHDEIIFPELLTLSLCNQKMTDRFLYRLLLKSPKLRKLNLAGAKITGVNAFDLPHHPLIDIDLNKCEINANVVSSLIKGTKLISLRFRIFEGEETFELNFSTIDCDKSELILLELHDKFTIDSISEIFDWGHRLRHITICAKGKKGNPNLKEKVLLPHLSSVDLTMPSSGEAELYELLEKTINLHTCRIPDECVSQRIKTLVTGPRYVHRKLHQQKPIFSTQNLQRFGEEAQKKRAGYIYDHRVFACNRTNDLISHEARTQYHCVPYFQHISGPELDLYCIRVQTSLPIFDPRRDSVEHLFMAVDLKEYDVPSRVNSDDSVYKRKSYVTQFQKPRPDLKLYEPWIRLESLTPNDILIGLVIEQGQDSSECLLWHSSSDGFYYITLKPNLVLGAFVVLTYYLVPRIISPEAILPREINTIREWFRNESNVKPDPEFKKKNLFDKLNEVVKNPSGHGCYVKADAFLFRMIEYYESEMIDGYRVGLSPSHAWAEILYGRFWISVDLGGRECDEVFSNDDNRSLFINGNDSIAGDRSGNQSRVESSHQGFRQRRHAAGSLINLNQTGLKKDRKLKKTPENYAISYEHLNLFLSTPMKNSNILIICKKDKDRQFLNTVRRYLQSLEPEHTTVIDAYENSLSSTPYIKYQGDTWEPVMHLSGPEGWVANRLKSSNRKQTRLIIDWSSMTASEGTKLNACIDLEDRQLDGVPINPSVQVLCLICENDSRLEDSSFLSRFMGNIFSLYTPPPKQDQIPFMNMLEIELYHSLEWKKHLLGTLGFDVNGRSIHTKKILMNAQNSYHLMIKNPPKNCSEFDRFIDDLEDGRDIKYLDQSIRFPRMRVSLKHGFDFSEYKKTIAHVYDNVTHHDLIHLDIDHLITPSTFERCIQTHHIVDGKLIATEGWLKQATTEHPLSLFITRNLSLQQYVYLLKDRPEKSLVLHFASGVEIPQELRSKIQPGESISLSSSFKKLKLDDKASIHSDPTIIDVSELTSDDLFYGFSYKKDPLQNRFIFIEVISDVLRRLERGEHVILKGFFSDEIVDHLSSLLLPNGYLWHDGKKKTITGKLSLSPSHPIKSLSWVDPQCFTSMNTLSSENFATRIDVKHEAERQSALVLALERYPYVFIEGAPGIGKSCFLRALKQNNHFKCYHFGSDDLNALKAWANSSDSRPTLLLIDEATMRGTGWSLFNGLMTPRRELLIDKKIIQIKNNQKVVFIGNRVNPMPAFLNKNCPTLVFHPLSRDEVIDQILTPIFAVVDPVNAYALAKAHYDLRLSVRELQSTAINQCAKQVFHLEQCISNRSTTRRTYVLAESRQHIFNSILETIHARRFMRAATADSARFGGQTCQILIGLPASGKSEIIHAAFQAKVYQRMTDLTDLSVDTRDHVFRYYHISATCSITSLRQHLKNAFQHGCIVMIDELDAILKADSPEAENEVAKLIAEINAYAMGEDLNGDRPRYAGFTLFATGNGIGFHGRAAIPQSLASRSKIHMVGSYTMKDCRMIIGTQYPKIIYDDLIIQYLNDPKTYTFRHLLSDCDKRMQALSSSYSNATIFHDYAGTQQTSHGEHRPQGQGQASSAGVFKY